MRDGMLAKNITRAFAEAFGEAFRQGLADVLGLAVLIMLVVMAGVALLAVQLVFIVYKKLKREPFGPFSLWLLRGLLALYILFVLSAFWQFALAAVPDVGPWIVLLLALLIPGLLHVLFVERYRQKKART